MKPEGWCTLLGVVFSSGVATRRFGFSACVRGVLAGLQKQPNTGSQPIQLSNGTLETSESNRKTNLNRIAIELGEPLT